MPASAAQVASLLPALEPILGASLAINLAYLNLPKFGYVSVVKHRVGDRLKNLDRNVRNQVKSTEWYVQLEALSRVETLDQALPSLATKSWISAPGLWGKLYNVLFYWRLGRGVSILASIHALVLLVLGVAHNAGITTFGASHFQQSNIGSAFRWATAGLIWPLLMVAAGSYVCFSAANFVRYQTKHLQEAAKTDANAALEESSAAVGSSSAQSSFLPTDPPPQPAAHPAKPGLIYDSVTRTFRPRRDGE